MAKEIKWWPVSVEPFLFKENYEVEDLEIPGVAEYMETHEIAGDIEVEINLKDGQAYYHLYILNYNLLEGLISFQVSQIRAWAGKPSVTGYEVKLECIDYVEPEEDEDEPEPEPLPTYEDDFTIKVGTSIGNRKEISYKYYIAGDTTGDLPNFPKTVTKNNITYYRWDDRDDVESTEYPDHIYLKGREWTKIRDGINTFYYYDHDRFDSKVVYYDENTKSYQDSFIIESISLTNNIYYKQNNIDLFRNFEPWHCGDSVIPENTYKNDLNNQENNEVKPLPKYQKYDNNKFSEKVITENYTYTFGSQDAKLEGYKIGTCPKAGRAQLLNDGTGLACIWKAYNGNIYLEKYDSDDITTPVEKTQIIVPEISHRNISKIGVLLVGGGGPAGKSTAYARSYGSCGPVEEILYFIPGTSGGGGAMVWGVLNLDATDEDHRFWLVPAKEQETRGTPGNNSYVTLKEPTTQGFITTDLDYGIIVRAKGGGFGAKGNENGQESYGEGGTVDSSDYVESVSYSESYRKTYPNTPLTVRYFTKLGEQKGCDGVGYTNKTTQAFTVANEINVKLWGGDDYTYTKTNSQLFSIGSVDNYQNIGVPGGNSWGPGANVQENKKAEKGGGGAGIKNSDGLYKGASGYWALFY